MLYSSPTIETKYFLLSNLKCKNKYNGLLRTREFACSNYYGEEIKNPIFETSIKPTMTKRLNMKNIIKPDDLFNSKKKFKINKSVSLRDNFVLNNKKELLDKIPRNYSSKKNNNLNIIKMNFPYCKPKVINSYSKLIGYKKKKDFIIAKNIENNKKKCI